MWQSFAKKNNDLFVKNMKFFYNENIRNIIFIHKKECDWLVDRNGERYPYDFQYKHDYN